jgi:hydroxymethylglutaryl-CoA reductase (NADPH)
MLWMQEPQNFEAIQDSFNSTSRFARLSKIHIRVASRHLFIRFVAKTGDAMGMNMLSKVSNFKVFKSFTSYKKHLVTLNIFIY